MTIEDFKLAVASEVDAIGVDGAFAHPDAVTWKRGLLTVKLFFHDGKAMITHIAETSDRSPFGVRTGMPGIPYDLTLDGTHRAAIDITDRLNNPYLYG